MTFDIGLHEVCVRTGVRYVITKFSGMDSLPNFQIFLPMVLRCARASRARELRYNHLDNHIPIIIIIYNIIYCLSLWTKCWERKPSNKLCISSFKLWRGSGGRGVLIPHSPSFLLWNVCCLHPLTCGRHGEYRRLNSRHSNVVWWHHLLVWIWKVFSDWLLCFQIRKPFVIGWTC